MIAKVVANLKGKIMYTCKHPCYIPSAVRSCTCGSTELKFDFQNTREQLINCLHKLSILTGGIIIGWLNTSKLDWERNALMGIHQREVTNIIHSVKITVKQSCLQLSSLMLTVIHIQASLILHTWIFGGTWHWWGSLKSLHFRHFVDAHKEPCVTRTTASREGKKTWNSQCPWCWKAWMVLSVHLHLECLSYCNGWLQSLPLHLLSGWVVSPKFWHFHHNWKEAYILLNGE